MKYTVERSCGHEEVISLFGKVKEREWKLRAAENKVCKECYLEEERKADEEFECPVELEGTEKQIKWAKSILRKKYDYIVKIIPKEKLPKNASFYIGIETGKINLNLLAAIKSGDSGAIAAAKVKSLFK